MYIRSFLPIFQSDFFFSASGDLKRLLNNDFHFEARKRLKNFVEKIGKDLWNDLIFPFKLYFLYAKIFFSINFSKLCI